MSQLNQYYPIIICLLFSMLSSRVNAYDSLRDIQVLHTVSDPPRTFCYDFNLTTEQVSTVFHSSIEIDREAYLKDYNYLPCSITGTAVLGQELVHWELRAGGNGIITKNNGEVIYLGCKKCEIVFGLESK